MFTSVVGRIGALLALVLTSGLGCVSGAVAEETKGCPLSAAIRAEPFDGPVCLAADANGLLCTESSYEKDYTEQAFVLVSQSGQVERFTVTRAGEPSFLEVVEPTTSALHERAAVVALVEARGFCAGEVAQPVSFDSDGDFQLDDKHAVTVSFRLDGDGFG